MPLENFGTSCQEMCILRSVSMRRSHRAKLNGNGLFYSAGVLSVSRAIETDIFKMPTNCCVPYVL